jgi:GT2 family glycosyltransferase
VKISLSIVTYQSDPELLVREIDSIADAFEHATSAGKPVSGKLFIMDNEDGQPSATVIEQHLQHQRAFPSCLELVILDTGGNIGYGRAHNLCLENLDSDYHVILNPDVILARDFLLSAMNFMANEPDVVAAAPYVSDQQGNPLYLCKRYPSILVFLLRGFAPVAIQKLFRKELEYYQMVDIYQSQMPVKEIKLISGCCMFLKTEALKAAAGFDPDYFLYFEDYDLCMRLHKLGSIAFAPAIRIVHFGGHASKKGWHHIKLFSKSGKRFFQSHGWKWI